VIGPLLIFDKSFLEMLNPIEIFELSLHFKFVGTPTLIGEIIADLKLPSDERTVPADVVKALSRKMLKVHGLQPANYRKLALANIRAYEIPMVGQVPVDSEAPNVHVTADRQGVLYDSTPEQELWARWAAGEFGADDELTATTWRNGIEQIDLDGLAKLWKPFTSKHFSSAKSQTELAAAVSAFLKNSLPADQREILNMTLDLLKASRPERLWANALMDIGEMRSLLEFAPYAASIIRLFLAFACGLARGFIGPRATNYIDLQYLYYSPFCMVFVSNDRFHREMWPATAGAHSFLWGQEVKDDLRRLVAIREKEKVSATEGAGAYELSSDPGLQSVVAEMWRTYMRPVNESKPTGGARTFEELDPTVQRQLKDAMKEFDKMDRAADKR
jgi:hypothetical protein